MDMQKFVDIQMDKIRNHPLCDHQPMIGKLIQEMGNYGYSLQEAQLMVSNNIISYMKELAKKLRLDNDEEKN